MVGLPGASSLTLLANSYASDFSPTVNSLPVFPLSCSNDHFDAFDSQGKDPCQVATALFWSNNQCYSSSAPPPGLAQLHNNQCLCNTVFYSLVYVCGLCTDNSFLEQSWPDYSGPNGLQYNPPEVTTYPPPDHSVPSDIVIPPWAFLPLTDGKVDLQRAMQTQTTPTATSPASSSTSAISSSIVPPASVGAPITTSPPAATTFASHPPSTSPAAPRTQESIVGNTSDGSQSANPSSSSASAAQSTVSLSSAPIQDGGKGDFSTSHISPGSNGTPPLPIVSPTPDVSTAAGTSNRRTASLDRNAFIGASAGLSAAAFEAVIAAVLLFRRDRRLTRAAKLAQLVQPRSVDLLGYAYEGLRQPGFAGADGAPHDARGRDPALEPLRSQQLAHNVRGARPYNATLPQPTPGTFEGRVSGCA